MVQYSEAFKSKMRQRIARLGAPSHRAHPRERELRHRNRRDRVIVEIRGANLVPQRDQARARRLPTELEGSTRLRDVHARWPLRGLGHVLDQLGLRLRHGAADGHDERHKLAPEHKRPLALGAGDLKLEQQLRALARPGPSKVRRRNIERCDRREITEIARVAPSPRTPDLQNGAAARPFCATSLSTVASPTFSVETLPATA